MIVACAKPISRVSSNTDFTGKDLKEEITILLYNIHHANPPSKPNVIDIHAIANLIRQQNPDLVALQEVDVYTNRSGSTLDQAAELGRLTGLNAYFGKAIDYAEGEYGVAILSKFPLTDQKNIALPTAEGTGGEHRTLASATITLPTGKQIIFASTHLDAQPKDTNRILQVTQIMELLKQEHLPVVIAGDFNAIPGSPVINKLDFFFTRTCIDSCGFTIPVIQPNKTIDFIAFTPGKFNLLSHMVIDEKYASDHLPVRAVLKLK